MKSKVNHCSSLNFSQKHCFIKNFFSFFFFVFGFCVIFFQGAFSGLQIMCICLFLAAAVLFLNPQKTTPGIMAVFLLTFFVVFNIVIAKGMFQNTVFEFSKWFLLILSGLCFLTIYKYKFILGLYWGISFAAFVGILAYLKIIPSEIYIYQLSGNVEGVRQLFSFFGYSNTAAVFFGSAIFIGLNLIDEKILSEKSVFLIALNVLAMYLTHSAFAFISFIFAVCVFYLAKHNRVKWFFVFFPLFIILTVTVFVVFKIHPGSTVISRIIYLEDAAKAFKPFGIGFGQWSETKFSVQSAIYSTDYLHNGFAQLLLEGGLHTFLVLITFMVIHIKGIIKKPCILALSIFIFLHSFVDIDMAYGGIYILLGYSVSYEEKKIYTKPSFRPLFTVAIIVAAFLICSSIRTMFIPESPEDYSNKIQNGTITVAESEFLYKGAAQVSDANSMYFYSQLWLEKAPKSQEAFDAVYNSINKMYQATLDTNYLTISRSALYTRKDIENASMNKLCKYLSKNNYIELP